MDEILLPTFNYLSFWMVNYAWFQRNRPAENQHLIPDSEVLLHVGQIPPPAMQPSGAVVQHDFKNRFGMLLEPFGAKGNHFSMSAHRLMKCEFGNWAQFMAVFISVRPMKEQVLNRPNAYSG